MSEHAQWDEQTADGDAAPTGAVGVSGGRLRAFVERIERLEEEKEQAATDIREVYAELKADGFDAPTVRKIVRLRKQDADARAEQEALLETYMSALGMA